MNLLKYFKTTLFTVLNVIIIDSDFLSLRQLLLSCFFENDLVQL